MLSICRKLNIHKNMITLNTINTIDKIYISGVTKCIGHNDSNYSILFESSGNTEIIEDYSCVVVAVG